MTQFKIEKGIPIPHRKPRDRATYVARPKIYPWDKMEFGDSFLIECPREDVKRIANCAKLSAYHQGYKIATRQVENGFRVWLVSYRDSLKNCP